MPVFSYKATNKNGEVVIASIEADSESIARSQISSQGLVLASIKLDQRSSGIQKIFYLRVSRKDLVLFSRQIAVMVGASIPIVQALRIVAEQTKNIRLKAHVSQIALDIEGGMRFSESLAQYNKTFDKFYVSMVESGEFSGKLDEVLNYLADQYEKDYDLVRKIQGALIYPVFVVSAMLLAGVITLVYVVPQLVDVFTNLGAELPFTTQLLINASLFVSGYWWLITIIGLILFFTLRMYTGTDIGKLVLSKVKLKIPIFGKLYQHVYLLRFTRSLRTLLQGGVDLVNALIITAGVIDDPLYYRLIQQTVDSVKDGNPLSDTLSYSSYIPPFIGQMLTIGETSGNIEYILEKITNYLSKEIDTTTNNIMTLVEPLIMIILGIGVGILVAAIFLPLYNLPTF